MSGAIEETREKWLCPHGCGILIDSPCRDEPREQEWENVPLQGLYWRFSGGAMHRPLELPYSPVPNEVIALDRLVQSASDEPRDVDDLMGFPGNAKADAMLNDPKAWESYNGVDDSGFVLKVSGPMHTVLAAVLAEVTQQTHSWRYEQNLLTQQIMLAADHIRAALRLSKEGGA